MKRKRQRPKLGDVFSIPLPNGTYAFGRLHEKGRLAIYKERSSNMDKIPGSNEYEFFVTVYRYVLTDGEWVRIGNIPFEHDDEAVGPPFSYIKDSIDGRFFLYENESGKMYPATEEQCEGLEVAAVWDRLHVIDRLMGTKKWL